MDSKWHWIATTRDGATAKTYHSEDGLVDDDAATQLPPSVTTNARIGSWNHSTSREYKGDMIKVYCFDEAFTEGQVNDIGNMGLFPQKYMTGGWELNE